MPQPVRSIRNQKFTGPNEQTAVAGVHNGVRFFATLSDAEHEQVAAAMKTVADLGPTEARHLRGEIYEVRASCDNRAFRVLFAHEGRRNQILLALGGFEKRRRKPRLERSTSQKLDWQTGGAVPVRDLLLDISHTICHIRYVKVDAWPGSNH
jgi:hypothetical protein